jgi:signal transduction histidine kinase
MAARIQDAVEDLDLTVKHIRTVIFDLESTAARGTGLRDRVVALTREARGPLGFAPNVTFDGPVDTLVDDDVGRDLLATLREALSNVARHAAATSADISVSAGPELVLQVRDDGRGLPDQPTTGLGLRNMARRAETRGGRFSARAVDGGGTFVEWAVPLEG